MYFDLDYFLYIKKEYRLEHGYVLLQIISILSFQER